MMGFNSIPRGTAVPVLLALLTSACTETTAYSGDDGVVAEISNDFEYVSDQDNFTNSFVSQAVTNRRFQDDSYLRIALTCDRSDAPYGHSTLMAGASAYYDTGESRYFSVNRISLKSNLDNAPMDVAWRSDEYPPHPYDASVDQDDIVYSKDLGHLKFNFLMPFSRGSLIGVTTVDLRTYLSSGYRDHPVDVTLDFSNPAIAHVLADCQTDQEEESR